MSLKLPSETIFHAVEGAIKAYRRFAQQQISKAVPGITIDQAMVLIYLHEHPDLNQNELAELLFKDTASLTRMIKTMVKHKFLEREINPQDLRWYNCVLTQKGEKVVDILPEIISHNRAVALKGISHTDQEALKSVLKQIIENCNTHIQ